MRYYAGIGARDTPPHILAFMEQIGYLLAEYDYHVRSGGARGADTAFETGNKSYCQEHGIKNYMQIFLPWGTFNGHKPDGVNYLDMDDEIDAEAAKIAKEFHPVWKKLNKKSKQFHTRNVYQVLGPDLMSNSEFVICWTVDGGFSGGTGQALRIADAKGIPIFNMQHDGFKEEFAKFFDKYIGVRK